MPYQIMTDIEREKCLAGMRDFAAELKQDPEKARAFLVGAGICKPNGGLTKHYRASGSSSNSK